jgi:hypothetical protein
MIQPPLLRTSSLATSLQVLPATTLLLNSIVLETQNTIPMGHSGPQSLAVILVRFACSFVSLFISIHNVTNLIILLCSHSSPKELDRSPRAGPSAAIRATVQTIRALLARTAWLEHQATVPIWPLMNLATSAAGLVVVLLMERHAQTAVLLAILMGINAHATGAPTVWEASSA